MTSSPDPGGAGGRVLLAAGTETYASGGFPDLERVPRSLSTVVRELTGLGYRSLHDLHGGFLLDPRCEQLRDELDRARAADAEVVVVYYTGHGERPEGDRYYVITHDSEPGRLHRSALPAAEFMQLVSRDERGEPRGDQPDVLVILDCCYSGTGGIEGLRNALADVGHRRTWIIASAGPLEWAQDGAFADALARALHQPTTGSSQRYLSLDTLVQAINDSSGGGQEARWFPPVTGSTGVAPFFPNPDYRPHLAGLTVDEQHWRSRLQAGEADTRGFYITGTTGRMRAVEELAAWLGDPDSGGGLAVLTGSPGSGKSALLSLPAFLAQPGRRAELVRDAAPGTLLWRAADLFHPDLPLIAVHARGLNTDQVAIRTGRGLDRRSGDAAALLEDLAATGPPPRAALIVDAVDEAVDPGGLLTRLLLPLGRAGLRVLIGARRHVLTPLGGTGADVLIDLDDHRYHDPDALISYVHQLLLATKEPHVPTPYRSTGQDDAARRTAEAIARRATAGDGAAESFLIARLLALSVRSRPSVVDVHEDRWHTELPAGVGAAFDEDLARRLGDRTSVGRALLVASAWARGAGLPWETIWVPVARAVTPAGPGDDGAEMTDADVRRLLDTAGSYIVEDLGPGGRSVFRPFHDLLAEHLRGEPAGGRRYAETAIARALLDTRPAEPSLRWAGAHPYLRTHLAEHAAAGEPDTLTDLIADPEFLAVADPVTLIPLLTPTDPLRRDAARVYRRAFPLLTEDPHRNLAHLQESAAALHVPALATARTGIRPQYRTRMASVRRDDSLLTLPHAGRVDAAAFGTGVDGRPVLATAGRARTVRLWDPTTGEPVGEPLTGHTESVSAVAFGTDADGHPLLATAGRDRTVRLWDPTTGTPTGRVLTGHTDWVTSVAFGTGADGRPVLATAGHDRTVRLWDATTGQPVGEPLTGHTRSVSAVAFGTDADGDPLLATASWDETVRLWDPTTGRPVGEPLAGHTDMVRSAAFGTGPNGRPVLATAGHDRTVRLWDPTTGEPVGEPLTGHTKSVSAVAFGTDADGHPLLATASWDETVRLWDPTTGRPIAEPLAGHTNQVRSVAFGADAGGRPVLATASWDRAVRLFDPTTRGPSAEPPTGHNGGVAGVALGTDGDGRPLLASAGGDGTARLWDPARGEPVGEPLTGHTGTVAAVAFGVGGDGRRLLATAGSDGTARLWDPATGEPVGEPLTGHTDALTSVAFGTDAGGRPLLATAGWDRTVRLWDPATGEPVGDPLTGHTNALLSVTFGTGADGRPLLATAGHDQTVRLWDPTTRSPAGRPITGHTNSVASVAFGADVDGRPLLATAGWDHTIRFWDPATGEPVGEPLTDHTAGVSSVAFGTAADGRPLLVSAGHDRTVRLWDPAARAAAGTLRRRTPARAAVFVDRAIAIGDSEGVSIVEPQR